MRANRRRRRRSDPLAHPEAIRALFESLRSLLPDVIPKSEKQLIKMLNAVRNVERHSVSDTKRGRPSHWKRTDLTKVASHLHFLLERETQGRISLNSFVSLYVRILDFPADVVAALVAEKINLFEAAQLSRLTSGRLNISLPKAKELRSEILKAHFLAQGSEASLRARVIKQLGGRIGKGTDTGSEGLGKDVVDELVEDDPYDTKHLFWEELRRIGVALRHVTPDDIDDNLLDDFLSASDHISNILARVEKRRQQRVANIISEGGGRH